MGIKALNPALTERYVSEADPGHNAILKNKHEIEKWQADADKGKDVGPRPEEVWEHDPKSTFWLIGTVDSLLMADLSDELISNGGSNGLTLKNADNDAWAARLALRGWENFTDDDGDPIEFKREKVPFRGRMVMAVPEELARLIPLPVLREIGRQAKKANTLTGVQEKNSVSASSPARSIPNGTVDAAQPA